MMANGNDRFGCKHTQIGEGDKLEVISEKVAKVTAVLNTLVLFSIITNF